MGRSRTMLAWTLAPPIVTSLVLLAYVMQIPGPTVYEALLKMMPSLCILLHVRNTTGVEIKDLLVMGSTKVSTVNSKEKGSTKVQPVPKTSLLQWKLTAGMTRGLIFSMIGDVLLVWHEVEGAFLLGMLAFALAQGCYISGLGFNDVSVMRGAGTYVTLAFVMLVVLSGAPPLFQYSVPFYGLLLATTLWRTMDRYYTTDGRVLWQRRALVLGALVFVVSDSSIAVFKFFMTVKPVLAQTVILSTYFTAQILLFAGAVPLHKLE